MDNQTLRTRRLIAIGAGVLVALLLIFGIKGCLDQRKERAMKDYVGDVDTVVQQSNQEGQALFRLLSNAGGQNQDVELQTSLNQFKLQSAQVLENAKGIDTPDELEDSHDYLIETLSFRAQGLSRIAEALPKARADEQRREGTQEVAAQMQAFLTSDVIYSQRMLPAMSTALRDQEILDEVRLPRSQFLPDIEWLQPTFVARRVRGLPSGKGDEAAAPGLHGNGITSASLGGQALSAGGSVSVPLADDLKFEVQVANQGENTETDVPVRVSIGRGDDAVELEGTLDTIAAGETKTVEIPVTDQPPTGQNVPIEIEVEAVPGEEKTDNNKQSYSAIFTK